MFSNFLIFKFENFEIWCLNNEILKHSNFKITNILNFEVFKLTFWNFVIF